MILHVVGSSSRGNCYILKNDKETLIVELGCRFNKIKKALDYDLTTVVGALLSHEDYDHGFALNAAMAAGIDCYSSLGTFTALGVEKEYKAKAIQPDVMFKLGGFRIKAFDVIHDAVEPFGFLIQHPETGLIFFITDTHFVPVLPRGVNHFLIEANYDEDILREKTDSGETAMFLYERIITSHMSIQTCKEFIQVADIAKVRNIVLLHLSDNHSHADNFKHDLMAMTGKEVTIATPGTKININLLPF